MKIIEEVPRLKKRQTEGHKGTFGNVFIIASSLGMTGAAYLCANSVLRSGAGKVVLGVPRSLAFAMASKCVCEMYLPLPETNEMTLAASAEREILEHAQKHDIVIIGPGLSRHPDTTKLILSVLYKINKPMIIDADGLNIISEEIPILRTLKQPVILTPHPGEMSRLTGRSISDVQKNRETIAFEFAKKNRVILALKGSRTVVTDGVSLYVNTTGNPGMATAGTGDVLTGVIAGISAQGLEPFEAAQLGVYVHGLAGDLAAQEKSEISLIASDIIDYLPEAFKRVYA